MKYVVGLWLGFFVTGCTGTGQPETSFPAYFVPTATNSFVVDDVTVDLVEARVAFGPVYFCASASGTATLCETARGEVLNESVFDALATEKQSAGTYRGFVGNIQSASYDYGIHWFVPQQNALPSANAPLGHSALFRGTARRAGTKKAFEIHIDIVPQYRGQRAVPTVPVVGDIEETTESLEMRFDLESWLSTIDYEEMLAATEDPYVIEKGDVNHDAVLIRMVSNAPVEFVFTSQ